MKKIILQAILIISILSIKKEIFAQTFSNTTAITINDFAPANPYPSAIAVSGLAGVITNVSVKINGLSHSWVLDMSILLQAPSGAALLLQSGTADGQIASNLTYTISDAGATQFSNIALWANGGTYKPTTYMLDFFAAPAPLAPLPPDLTTYKNSGPFGGGTATFASTFNNLDPNGTWKLFVQDFASGDGGAIAGGWELTIATNIPTPINLTSFYATRLNNQNTLHWTTENEINFSHFDIEHSSNDIEYTKVASINSLYSNENVKHYAYALTSLPVKNNYYRLKIVDLDGSYNYSSIVNIKEVEIPISVNVYPNVVSTHVNIVSTESIINEITIIDITGKRILNIFPNTSIVNILRSQIPASSGIYFLQYVTDDLEKHTEKIVLE